jgi:threonine synthase
MRNMVFPASVNDELTLETMEYVCKKYKIFIDPHTAVAFAAARQVAGNNAWEGHVHTVVLATAHYAKEADLVRRATGQNISVSAQFRSLKKNADPIAVIPPNPDAFENAIASCF